MDSGDNTYHFNPQKLQGHALVITNFTTDPEWEDGAERAHKNMTKAFKRLGFQVDCHKDVTESDLKKLLEQYSKTDLNMSNCFAFSILSHGHEVEEIKNGNIVKRHALQMVDGSHFYTEDILAYFKNETCSALEDKPKIFFIQACRIPISKSTDAHRRVGIGFDQGSDPPNLALPSPAQPSLVQPNSAQPNPVKTNPVVNPQGTKSQIHYPPAPVEITLVPCHNDMLIMFGCPEGHYAFGNSEDGCDMFRLFSELVGAWYTKSGPASANLMDMLRDVTDKMSAETHRLDSDPKEYKTVPCIVHKLRKDVIFTRE